MHGALMEVGNQPIYNYSLFGKKGKPQSQASFSVKNMKIDNVQAYRYLGVTFCEDLSFNDACQELTDAGGKALGGIIVKFN